MDEDRRDVLDMFEKAFRKIVLADNRIFLKVSLPEDRLAGEPGIVGMPEFRPAE